MGSNRIDLEWSSPYYIYIVYVYKPSTNHHHCQTFWTPVTYHRGNTIFDWKPACPKFMKLVREMGRLQCNIPVVLFAETNVLEILPFRRFNPTHKQH